MPDEADRADARIEAAVMDAIARARRSPSLPYTGHCHWCAEPTADGRRFCDTDCRDAWERDHARRRRS
ncbi:MAG: hypothetical protein AB1412_09445 [Pseudomonadota bacterium]